MTAIRVITPDDLGTGLKVEGNKVVVNRDELNIPVDIKLAGVEVNKAAQTMKFTLSDGTHIEQNIADFLAVDTDTTLTSGAYAGNKITLTDSAQGTVEIDLATLVQEIKAAAEQKAGELVQAAKTELGQKDTEIEGKVTALEQAKSQLETKDADLERRLAAVEGTKPTGIQVTSLAGTTLGYLVDASAVNNP